MSGCMNLKLQCLLRRMGPADPSLTSNGSRLLYHIERNSSGTNLGKIWNGMQKAELERKRLTEECIIAQRENVTCGKGKAIVQTLLN